MYNHEAKRRGYLLSGARTSTGSFVAFLISLLVSLKAMASVYSTEVPTQTLEST